MKERAENNVTYKTHSQAMKKKAKLYMDLARVDSYFKAPVEIRKKMLVTAKKKKKQCDSIQTMNRIRKEKKIESLTKSIERNEKRNSGERRGRASRASDVEMVELRKPVSETQEMGVNKFTRRAQIPYIVEEFLTLRMYPGDAEEAKNFRTLDRVSLMAMKKIEDVKRELRKALGLDPLDKTFDKTKFKVQSDKSKSIGGAAKLIGWTDVLE